MENDDRRQKSSEEMYNDNGKQAQEQYKYMYMTPMSESTSSPPAEVISDGGVRDGQRRRVFRQGQREGQVWFNDYPTRTFI